MHRFSATIEIIRCRSFGDDGNVFHLDYSRHFRASRMAEIFHVFSICGCKGHSEVRMVTGVPLHRGHHYGNSYYSYVPAIPEKGFKAGLSLETLGVVMIYCLFEFT